MRPRLPLVLLSALLACFISPSWSDYTLTGNGETTISFADGQYTITPPEWDPVTQADSPGDIYLTVITASGTYEDGYNRVLNLEGGTYTKLQLWNVAGTALTMAPPAPAAGTLCAVYNAQGIQLGHARAAEANKGTLELNFDSFTSPAADAGAVSNAVRPGCLVQLRPPKPLSPPDSGR